MNWHGYELVRIEYSPTAQTKAIAKAASVPLLGSKPQRLRMFGDLLVQNGLPADLQSEAVLRSVFDFFIQNVEASSSNTQVIGPEWESFAIDLGLVLGDHMIAKKPYLRWAFLDGDKRQLNAWQTGLIGFEYGIYAPPLFVAQSGNVALSGMDCAMHLDYAFGWS